MASDDHRSESTDPSLTISVVVPTKSRPESATRAVHSALNQTHPPHEVVVVVDGPDPDTVRILGEIGDSRIVVVELPHNVGPAQARNIGTQRCTGEWVAFLDDDDEWLPEKLRRQAICVARASENSQLVLATGVEWREDSTVVYWPLRGMLPNESVTDYLFVRRQPGEGLLHTSTIMLKRQFAMDCPYPRHLRLHEDYDWFIDLQEAGATFDVIVEPLAVYNVPTSRPSLSSAAQWHISLAWALSRKGDMSRRAYSEFCLSSVARLARPAGIRAQAAVFAAAISGDPSWFAVWRFMAICLLPDDARRRLVAKLPLSRRRES